MVSLWFGSCYDYMEALQGVECLISDPPYGIKHRRGKTGNRKRGPGKHIEKPIIGDDMPFDPAPFLKFRTVVLFGANHYAKRLPENGGWTFWHKRPGMKENDFSDGELIWDNSKHPLRYIRHMWNGVLRDSEVGQECYHPTQKPVALMKILIQKYARPGDVIFDPFMGSGSTGVAAVEMGYPFVGCELDPGYFSIAKSRIERAQLQPMIFTLPSNKSLVLTGGDSAGQLGLSLPEG